MYMYVLMCDLGKSYFDYVQRHTDLLNFLFGNILDLTII